jgi:hypothetical protein
MTCKSSSQLSVIDIVWQFGEPKADIAAGVGIFVKEIRALAKETVTFNENGVRQREW